MKQRYLAGLGIVFALTAQGQPETTAPGYDVKPQALQDLRIVQKHFADLAAAIPIAKFSWRPGDGVRSFSEIFLHVASLNFSLAPHFGAAPIGGFSPNDFEKSTTDKAKIIEQINRSFDYACAALEKRTNTQLQAIVKEFGPEASEGDLVYLIVADAHEHLGQAVAYARMNGIVPPWTAAQIKK